MLLLSAVSSFAKVSADTIKHWRVTFEGEPAIDIQGVRREFFTLLGEGLRRCDAHVVIRDQQCLA